MGVILKPRRMFVFLPNEIGVGGLKRKKVHLKNSSCGGEDRETSQGLSSSSGKGGSRSFHRTSHPTVPFH